MPQIFKIGSYWVYFWSNEGEPIEPVHVHVSYGKPRQNATKVWITKRGKCLVEYSRSDIPPHVLRDIVKMIEARSDEIVRRWVDYFGDVSYFC